MFTCRYCFFLNINYFSYQCRSTGHSTRVLIPRLLTVICYSVVGYHLNLQLQSILHVSGSSCTTLGLQISLEKVVSYIRYASSETQGQVVGAGKSRTGEKKIRGKKSLDFSSQDASDDDFVSIVTQAHPVICTLHWINQPFFMQAVSSYFPNKND